MIFLPLKMEFLWGNCLPVSSKFVLLRKRLLSQRNVNFLNNCQQLHVMDASRSADLIARGERERQYGNLGATNQTESGNLDAEAEFNADGMIGLLAAGGGSRGASRRRSAPR